MDPSLEEAAEIAGAGPLRTLFTVTFPLIAPAILSGMLLSFIVMLGIYGIPAVLGAPANITVLTTYIFNLTAWSPPLYSTAAAVAIILMVVTGALVAPAAACPLRPQLHDRRRQGVPPARAQSRTLALSHPGAGARLPLDRRRAAECSRCSSPPSANSSSSAASPACSIPGNTGCMHFQRLFANPLTLHSIVNTMEVGLITALIGGMLAFAIGYTVNRTRRRPRAAIDLIATLPVAIPGLVIGVAYLWAWIGLPGGLYGTIWILALAFVARFIPDTMKALSTSLMQIHRELEEAAWICGRGTLVHHPHHRAAAGAARRDRGDDAALHPGDPRARLVAFPLQQQFHGDGRAAARLLRCRTSASPPPSAWCRWCCWRVLIGIAHWLSRGSRR